MLFFFFLAKQKDIHESLYPNPSHSITDSFTYQFISGCLYSFLDFALHHHKALFYNIMYFCTQLGAIFAILPSKNIFNIFRDIILFIDQFFPNSLSQMFKDGLLYVFFPQEAISTIIIIYKCYLTILITQII